MKRKRLVTTFEQQKNVKSDHIQPSILTKRKGEDRCNDVGKRCRIEDTQYVEELRRRNFELEQMVHALIAKNQTLEYMIQMFRRNETINNNNLITAY